MFQNQIWWGIFIFQAFFFTRLSASWEPITIIILKIYNDKKIKVNRYLWQHTKTIETNTKTSTWLA